MWKIDCEFNPIIAMVIQWVVEVVHYNRRY